VLPVDGVAGRPLLHCGTPPSQLKNSNLTCRDPRFCQCAGPNITDPSCANDNFGGSWLLPPEGNRSLTFVYSQARRLSAFAPHAVPYDNLATVRRVLVTWATSDGLTWTQRFWSNSAVSSMKDGLLPPETPIVKEHYGAQNFCSEDNRMISARGGCRAAPLATNASKAFSPILSWFMPFDAARQQFWMDFAYSVDGLTFRRPDQENVSTGTAMANGQLGTWNGGILMGVDPPHGIRDGKWTHALLSFADSGAHFMFAMRERANFSASAVRAWGESEFFGPSISQWPQWSTVGGVGGWQGLAAAGERIRIEVGSVRWSAPGVSILESAHVD
jgi:hypothetical protein